MEIGAKLRELRIAKNLSQGDIEKRTGLFRCYTSRVENGYTVPTIGTLEKYASALESSFVSVLHRRRVGCEAEAPKRKLILGSQWQGAQRISDAGEGAGTNG